MYVLTCYGGYPLPIAAGKVEIVGFRATVSDPTAVSRLTVIDDDDIKSQDVVGKILPSENNRVTVGGWLIEQVGDIPKAGSKYTLQGFLFHVLAADLKRISRIYIRKLKVHS